ncbi:MAG: hypothetical protein MUE72_11665 [Chitinophagaceae bacterium]|nr:hypothetical protein [Chitinophagaceae bacterium]
MIKNIFDKLSICVYKSVSAQSPKSLPKGVKTGQGIFVVQKHINFNEV